MTHEEAKDGPAVVIQDVNALGRGYPWFHVWLGEVCIFSGNEMDCQRLVKQINYAISPLLRRAELAPKLAEALDWFIGEAERAKRKGYDLTELTLERCLANANEVKTAWDAIKGEGE